MDIAVNICPKYLIKYSKHIYNIWGMKMLRCHCGNLAHIMIYQYLGHTYTMVVLTRVNMWTLLYCNICTFVGVPYAYLM